jgi:carbon storage regulator CsrA
MLVLSRQPGETILFPTLGVTVHLLAAKGRTVRIGIEAPPDVKVLRQELQDTQEKPQRAQPASLTHWLRNRLNRIGLGLHLSQRQRQAGQDAQADASLDQALASLEALAGELKKPPAPATAARPRFRTLLVEDDTNERELLAGLLNVSGCDCETVVDGLDALNYLGSHDRPDLVLLDLRLPRCDGAQTLAAIRRDPRLAGLKVFAVSGTPPGEMGISDGPEGVDAWFPKPLNARKLLATIQQSLSPSPQTR